MRTKLLSLIASAVAAVALTVGLSQPAVTHAVPAPSGVNTGPWGVALGDLNKDGQQDIVVATGGGNTIRPLISNGSALDSYLPVKVFAINPAALAAVGGAHACLSFTNKSLRCWGRGTSGQLGTLDDTAAALNQDSSDPKVVTGVTAPYRIALGANHSCVIILAGKDARAGGPVTCWGDNSSGQLGRGSVTATGTPGPVTGITDAIEISLGANHTCAILADRSAKCWGDNTFGQLGNGSRDDSSLPVAVSSLERAQQISAGSTHTCATSGNGSSNIAKCWGNGSGGRVGDGTGSRQPVLTPTQVSNISSVSSISAGGSHTCAIAGADKAVSCWGVNSSGQLGLGTTDNQPLPAAVQTAGKTPLVGVTAIASGGAHTCAQLTSTEVDCWGSNSNGQIGDGQPTLKTRLTPVPVPKLRGTTGLAVGDSETCAIDSTKTLLCSGNNLYGQLGNGFGFVPQPPVVAGSSPASLATVDVNDDGNLDVVAPNAGHDKVQRFLGDGQGKLSRQAELEIQGGVANSLAGSTPTDVAITDIDKDKFPDIVTANVGTKNLGILVNDGTGDYEQQLPNPSTGRLPNGLSAVDLNKDGRIDFGSATYGNGSMMVQIQQPLSKKDKANGLKFKFGGMFQFTVGAGPVGVVSGDFDGDGYPDLATACQYDGTVELILTRMDKKKKKWGFVRQLIKLGVVPQSITVGDVTGDKKLDIIISDTSRDTVTIVPTLGKNKFGKAIKVKLPNGSAPVTVAAGDVSGDKLADIVVVLGESESIGILLSRGKGVFKFSQSEPLVNNAPVLVSDPVIASGLPELDATLIASPGEWDINGDQAPDDLPQIPDPAFDPASADPGAEAPLIDPYLYQWQRSTNATRWVDIPDATTGAYTATTDDLKRYLRACVTAYSGAIQSDGTGRAGAGAVGCTEPTKDVVTDPNEDTGGEGIKNRRWKR